MLIFYFILFYLSLNSVTSVKTFRENSIALVVLLQSVFFWGGDSYKLQVHNRLQQNRLHRRRLSWLHFVRAPIIGVDHTGWGDGIPSMVQIALCFGLIVGTMVRCIGHISGGHINPAVTVALLVTRKISVVRAVLFVVAQCIGAMIGAALLKVLWKAL